MKDRIWKIILKLAEWVLDREKPRSQEKSDTTVVINIKINGR